MNSIRDWLNSSRSYTIGVALYKVYGDNPELKEMFSQGFNAYRQNRLQEELSNLNSRAETITAELPGQEVPVEVMLKTAPLPEITVPADKDPYREKWLPRFQEMKLLQGRLRYYTSDQERGEAAHRILDLNDECRYWWDRRDYYLRTGQHMPEDPANVPDSLTDKNQLQKRLNTIRTYVSRYTKKVADHPLNSQYRNKLEQYLEQRSELEQKLGYERTLDQSEGSTEPAE